MSVKKISIITPIYNEEENISDYYEKMSRVLAELSSEYNFEIIFMDNCSTDKSFLCLKELARKDQRIKVFKFSRNFGYQKSILTGYQKCTGDAAIEFDCDLQDPPELLKIFLDHWKQGIQIVYGIRSQRAEGVGVTFARKLFYRLINAISNHELPHDAGDFMLIDRKILDYLCKVDDQNLYLRGVIFGLGYRRLGVPYSRNPRLRGTSKFPFMRMLELAIDGIISQSTLPLRISAYVGILVALITCLMSGFYLYLRIFHNEILPSGFTTTVLLVLFGISLNAIFLGVIGEYIARIYMQTKKMPMTIVDEQYP